MKNHYIKYLLAMALLALPMLAPAEDIDLFAGVDATAQTPYVLFVMDNGANFDASATNTCTYADDHTSPGLGNTAAGIEQCALVNAIVNLKTSITTSSGTTSYVPMYLGFMAYNQTNIQNWVFPTDGSGTITGNGSLGSACGSNNGGCLVVPFIKITPTNKPYLISWIKNWKISNGDHTHTYWIKASGESTGAAQQEAWAYYTGKTGLSGRNYSSIAPTGVCAKYLFFLGNAFDTSGTPGDGGSAKPEAPLEGTYSTSGANANPAASSSQKALITGSVHTTCGNFTFTSTKSTHNTNGLYADEWSRYMFQTQDIVTYTIGVINPSTCKPDYPALLKSMASNGGNGEYYEVSDATTLQADLNDAFTKVQAINSAFASVSLPVSVNATGTYLNQVFIGMFRPDPDANPRWNGNLKQYKMAQIGTSLLLVDADNGPNTTTGAIDNSTGFLDSCARSFWTPSTADTYWAFHPEGACGIANSKYSNSPDGKIVEKGAQAYMLRNLSSCTPAPTTSGSDLGVATTQSCSPPTTPRAIYTCSSTFASCTSLTSFTSGTTTHGDWELGQDMQDENGNSQTTTEIRPSVHGDVLHSRPVAIAYSGTYAGDVVVYYGSNDGILHAINGSRTGSIGSFPAGAELWSFVAPETYGNISTLYNNTATLNFTDLTAPSGKPYGFDGPITSYQGSGSTWVFAPMRRGGRALYAFDVTNPTSPSLKWKVGCPNNFTAFGTVSDTGCTTGFTGIGQTWSAGVTMTASGYTDPVLIMGGGYDTCEDADPRNCTGSAKGNHIYILNANDGTLQRTLDTDRAVTADVFVIKDSSTGIAKWAYAVDLGGNIYRISGVDANTPFNSTSPSSWTITKIASLGGTGASARKFLFSPDIVLDPDGSYDILVGSGDREKPLHSFSAAYGVTNYFFMVKDKPTDSSWLNTSNTDCGGGNNYICLASLNEIGVTNSTGCSTITGTPSSYGWYLDLNTHEQVVTSPITVFNTTTFSTHTPVSATSNICSSSLGTPRVYNINYTNPSTYGQCSSTAIQTYIGKDIGLPPSPVAGMVQLDDGTIVPFVIGADPTSPLQSKPPTGSSSWTQPTQNVYWFIQQ